MKPINKLWIISQLLFILLTITFSACNDSTEREVENKKPSTPTPIPSPKTEPKKEPTHTTDEYSEEKVNLKFSDQDKKYLTLIDSLPLGTTSGKIQERMNTKSPRPEGNLDNPSAKDLTESKAKVNFLGKPAEVEFNFKNDSLYSFYYSFNEADFNQAEKLYKGIRQYYVKKYGPCEEPVAEEETKHIRNCYWREKAPYGVMTYDINAGRISWGFQNVKP